MMRRSRRPTPDAAMDTLKAVALIATFIGVFSIFATLGIAVGERVADLSRAHTSRNLRHSTDRLAPSSCLSHSWS